MLSFRPRDRRLLVRHHGKYVKGPGFERVKMLLGNGLIVSDGETWRRSRRMIQPAFTRQSVHRLIAVMVECCDRRAVRWAAAAERGDTLNITAETSDFALELILISIFGDDYEKHILAEGDNPFAFLSQDSTRDLGVVMKVRHLRELLMRIIELRRADDRRLAELAGDERGVARAAAARGHDALGREQAVDVVGPRLVHDPRRIDPHEVATREVAVAGLQPKPCR